MPLFKYKAKDKEGKIYERTVETATRFDIYSIIRNEGGKVVSIKEARKFAPSFSFNSLFSGITTHQKIIFAKNLGLMMKAGLPLTRALSVMGRQSKSKSFKRLLTELEKDISHGETLSESLAKKPKTFSALFVSMVKAGEESGGVSGALILISNQMEKLYNLVKKVRGAFIYPSIIISVMILISIALLIFMVPTLTETFEGIGAELPFSTRMIIAASSFLTENTILVLASVVTLAIASVFFLRSRGGKRISNMIFYRIPVVGGMLKEFESARTARTLSSLLSSGVEIVAALDATKDVVQNHLYKEVLSKAHTAVERGEPMSKIFVENEHLYPIFVGEMIAVGEETGKISEMLVGVADYYEEVVDQKTKNLSTIIEPVLMIIIGIGVGIFAVSMLAPTYSLVDYI